MARVLADDQVRVIREALGALPDIASPEQLCALVAALRGSKQSAYAAEELEGIERTIDAMAGPLEAKPRWSAGKARGLFFVFEGLDRSGKSTQSRKLREHLQKTAGSEGAVKWMCFPNRETATGSLIDLYLRNQIELPDGVVHLLFSANRWEAAAGIVEDLNHGTTIVCDRYAFSGVAYSAAKGLDFAWCQAPDKGLPCPDGVFFMKVEPSVGAARANFGDERYENATLQARVREEFQRPTLNGGVAWNTVDGDRGVEEIHEEIREKVASIQQAGQENDTRAVQRLWAA